jgi:ribosomal protein L24E
MTKKLSRERALTAALDPLHTEATELARFASKASDHSAAAIEGLPTSAPAARSRRRPLISRRRRTAAAAAALLLAGFGSATLAGSAASASTVATPNSVLSFGAAPSITPDFGLALHAGVIGIAANPAGHGYWLVGSDGGVFAFGRARFFGSTGNDRLNAPIVAIAATPKGRGYWLVASDGGVFAFGDAKYEGSTAGAPLAAPIVAMLPTTDGHGYWLVASDGGVFAFGNAHFHGSAVSLKLASPIVGAAASQGGHGYWLLGSDGGVFAFGDAKFHGAPQDAQPAAGIAASPKGHGYWVAHTDGSVRGFGVGLGNPSTIDGATTHPNTVGIAASADGGYWLAQGAVNETPSLANDPFLACTRAHESDHAGGYGAVSSSGTYRGAYQFDRSTWDNAARLAGRFDLVGVDPAAAAPADQDLVAMALFHAQGGSPWGSRCSGLS